jgi:hypothetical protein
MKQLLNFNYINDKFKLERENGKEEIGWGYRRVKDGTQRRFEFCYLNLKYKIFYVFIL